MVSSIAEEHILESLTYLVKKRTQEKKYLKNWKKKKINEEAEIDILEETIDRAHHVGPKKKKSSYHS